MSLSKQVATALVVGSALTLAAAWYKWRKNGPPSKWKKIGVLSELWCYPIKSCGVINLKHAECGRLGLKNEFLRDRVLMITGLDYSFKTSRTYPKMTLIQPRIEEDVIFMTAPEMPEVKFSLSSLSKEAHIAKIWDQPVKAHDCGDEVAAWLSKYLLDSDTGCRLVFYPLDNSMRAVKTKNRVFKNYKDKDFGGLSDATSYMIMNEASLDDLNSRLPEGTSPCTALQFRPNFVVKGDDNLKAYDEDNWQWIKIGETIFQVVMPCTRCISTVIDPLTGTRNKEMEPLKTLRTYRLITDPVLKPATGNSPAMGQHMAVYKEGSVCHGDTVFVGV